jgi:hypothetical protein
MERLVWRLKTAGLSNTNNHKNPIIKYEGLGNQLMHAACVLKQNGQGSLALISRWLLLKVLEVELLKIHKVVGA